MHKIRDLFFAVLVSFPVVGPLHAAGSFDVYLGITKAGMEEHPMYGYFKNGIWHEYKRTPGSEAVNASDFHVEGGKFYALGSQKHKSNDYRYGYWIDQAWHALTAPPGYKVVRVNKITTIAGDIYITGAISKIQYQHIPGYWKNGAWHNVEAPYPNFSVTDMFIDQGKMTLTGSHYDEAKNQSIFHFRKDGKWQDVELKPNMKPMVKLLSKMHRGDLYQVGEVRLLEKPMERLPAYWKNGVMQWYGTQLTVVTCMLVDGDDVYIGGWDNEFHPGYWKKGQWVALPFSGHRGVSGVNSMYKAGDTLFVGGQNPGPDSTTTYPGYWANNEWTLLKHPQNNDNIDVLYIGAEKRP